MQRTAIIGFGNPVRNDDGIGVRVVSTLEKVFEDREDVTVLDLGTNAFEILFKLRGHDRIILVDATTNSGDPEGTVFRLPTQVVEEAYEDDPLVFLHGMKWNQALSYSRKILRQEFPDEVSVYLIAVENVLPGETISNAVDEGGKFVIHKIKEELCRNAS